MMSSNGNIFRITGHLCREFTSPPPPPVNSPHKGQWHGALMFSLICIWINGWVNNREAGDVSVMTYVSVRWHLCIETVPRVTSQKYWDISFYQPCGCLFLTSYNNATMEALHYWPLVQSIHAKPNYCYDVIFITCCNMSFWPSQLWFMVKIVPLIQR